ncbi:hypothetical protein [Dactylosporangium sp. CS-033363]|uniref:hypothetical protein n=1 Tax=Dactylosporangium sp. CS-033363 TaxID=3239935 RepID=UPI003D93CCC3
MDDEIGPDRLDGVGDGLPVADVEPDGADRRRELGADPRSDPRAGTVSGSVTGTVVSALVSTVVSAPASALVVTPAGASVSAAANALASTVAGAGLGCGAAGTGAGGGLDRLDPRPYVGAQHGVPRRFGQQRHAPAERAGRSGDQDSRHGHQ